MQSQLEKHGHDAQCSEFIRHLVQKQPSDNSLNRRHENAPPKIIFQYWHDLEGIPNDVRECIDSWTQWESAGFSHIIFDRHAAKTFIADSLSVRHVKAFERCYHPAMQADYFRLCYLCTKGGIYVDADDVRKSSEIEWLMNDDRLKVQPLCYDISSGAMVKSSVFLCSDAYDASWIFYFNNNPLVSAPNHPIIVRALREATRLLELTEEGALPEIQSTTGPGNLTRCVFELSREGYDIESELLVLREWEQLAVSRWPLSYRDDARNWRHSNQQRFEF